MKNKHRYPENWSDVIRPAILKRDNFKCDGCGVKHRSTGYYDFSGKFIECDEFMVKWAKEKGFKVQKIFLQIAHLDQDPSNCSEDNLKSKCPKCHLNFDRAFNNIKRLQRKRTN